MRRLGVYLIICSLIILGGCNNSTTPQDANSVLIPPWPDAEVFYDETTVININLRDEFIIRYDYYHNLFPIFEETYDPNSVRLLKKSWESTSGPTDGNGIKWYLFQAIKEGDTEITIKLFTHQSDVVQDQKTFKVKIVQP